MDAPSRTSLPDRAGGRLVLPEWGGGRVGHPKRVGVRARRREGGLFEPEPREGASVRWAQTDDLSAEPGQREGTSP